MTVSTPPGDATDQASSELLDLCREAMREEANAMTTYAAAMGQEFLDALRIMQDASDPVVVAGIGKSGHIARKIAATFLSIGRPAVFLHAAEASHGDLGLVGRNSAVLLLSNSGETAELSDLISYCEAHDVPMVAITRSRESTLGRRAQVTLAYGAVKEVCPNGLAPTTSTTLMLAIGDALAVGLTSLLGTTAADFRRYHPGGKLGARLLRARDLMHHGDMLPLVKPDTPMQEVVITMSSKGFGVALVMDNGEVVGIITDGDMRRNINRLWRAQAGDIILGKPMAISPDMLAGDALATMSSQRITCLVVEDERGRLQGLLRLHDCVRAGVAG
ncbi:KpsF/GutQ family sugar-phosphate isomerase [Aquabacter cavernae]|uniref:KpsF/GutQ family sugar-phosphate isomerase n=1 Tax=Aquabacter cavernae TaxID=2496029 RepID=UPI00196A742F|nr:KpsF/GutQ family sugar-phosphate isomerase [Aquabacter cavernae]